MNRIAKQVLVLFSLFFFLFLSQAVATQPPVIVKIFTQHGKWSLHRGEMTVFQISVVDVNNKPMKNVQVKYEVGPEMVNPFDSGTVNLPAGIFKTKAYTLYSPGFLRCNVSLTVDGVMQKKMHTVGYDEDRIIPTVNDLTDFDSFWTVNKESLKHIPINPKIVLLQEKSTSEVEVYHVSVDNINGSKFYGVLAIPKRSGRFPAVLQVPGAGVRPYSPDIKLAQKGVIVFTVGIHGVPVNMDSLVYVDLARGALDKYFFNGLASRDSYYYKRVILGCIRSVDFLFTLDKFDKKNVAVFGASQGGALSIMTASLDERIKTLVAFFPALSDLTGYLEGRAGGWPHVFSGVNQELYYTKDVVKALSYYDVVNFARRLKVPGFYSWGFNDNICPPTSMYATYNVITAPKRLSLYHELGHWLSPSQRTESIEWLVKALKEKK